MKKNILLILMLFIGAVGFSQELNGEYLVNLDGNTRHIEVSPSNNTFTESDDLGNQLGNGTYYIEDEMYVFVPDVISATSLMNGVIHLYVGETHGNTSHVRVRYQGEKNGRAIQIEKL